MKDNKFSIKLVWGIVIVLVYLCMVYLLLFTSMFEESIEFKYRVIFAILFGAYGLFRGYRLWKSR